MRQSIYAATAVEAVAISGSCSRLECKNTLWVTVIKYYEYTHVETQLNFYEYQEGIETKFKLNPIRFKWIFTYIWILGITSREIRVEGLARLSKD